ncbi:MAG: calcium/sodium antiporter [Muribaculaceae bacterium]|nr:calcium/sodium antiporter [Muribaculaceae bacterium]
MTDILLLAGGLVLILAGANMLTDGSGDLARRMGISDLVVGLTVVAFGTSAPELVISVISAIKGSGELAIGNVVGSNIFNICAIIGIVSIIRPMKVKPSIMNNEIPVVFIAALTLWVFGNLAVWRGGSEMILTRWEGIYLIGCMIYFMYYTVRKARDTQDNDPENQPQEAAKPPMSLVRAIIYVVIGLGALIYGGDIFVDGAGGIARAMGVSEAVIGLTIVAAGTSLPELAVSITAALKGKPELAIGNVIGSNIFNIFMVLGVAAAIHPLSFGSIGNIDLVTMLVTSFLFWAFAKFYKVNIITRLEGSLLVIIYIAYTAWLIINA